MHIENLDWVEGEPQQHLRLMDFGAAMFASGTLALKSGDCVEVGRSEELRTIIIVLTGAIEPESCLDAQPRKVCKEGQMLTFSARESTRVRAVECTRAIFIRFGTQHSNS